MLFYKYHRIEISYVVEGVYEIKHKILFLSKLTYLV